MKNSSRDMGEAILNDSNIGMARKAVIKPVAGDYYVDGILYCGRCKSPKQAKITVNGVVLMPAAKCKCPEPPIFVRPDGVPREWCFENDDGASPASRQAHRFVESFPMSLLFYGAVGTGKSFLAGCICNELGRRGKSTIMDTARGYADKAFNDHEFLGRLMTYDLVVLDDLAAERKTDYLQETVFQIINMRTQANKPIVITTNLTAEQMKHADNVNDERIFSRVLSVCIPVLVSGIDRRREQGRKRLEEWRKKECSANP